MHRNLGRHSERLKDYERGDIYNFRKLVSIWSRTIDNWENVGKLRTMKALIRAVV